MATPRNESDAIFQQLLDSFKNVNELHKEIAKLCEWKLAVDRRLDKLETGTGWTPLKLYVVIAILAFIVSLITGNFDALTKLLSSGPLAPSGVPLPIP